MLVFINNDEPKQGLIINSLDICSKNIDWQKLEKIDTAIRNAMKKEKEVKKLFTRNGRFRPDKCVDEMKKIKDEWWEEVRELFNV